jgi:stress response protein SCP2
MQYEHVNRENKGTGQGDAQTHTHRQTELIPGKYPIFYRKTVALPFMIHVSRPIDKIKNISIAQCTGKSKEDRERYKIHYESPPIQPKKMLLAVIVDKQQTTNKYIQQVICNVEQARA